VSKDQLFLWLGLEFQPRRDCSQAGGWLLGTFAEWQKEHLWKQETCSEKALFRTFLHFSAPNGGGFLEKLKAKQDYGTTDYRTVEDRTSSVWFWIKGRSRCWTRRSAGSERRPGAGGEWARAFGAHAPDVPGATGLGRSSFSFDLTVYVKERGSDRGLAEAAAACGQHPIREPKNRGKIADW